MHRGPNLHDTQLPSDLAVPTPCASDDKGTCQAGGEVLNSAPKWHQLGAPSSKGAQASPL
ncbi:hypothetical protein MRCP2_p1460 (plasmid) [Aquipseudomonas alcaligenes]|nr:hypothetical protein MRCP2_p1460 [Pseudomonas alcaligenes]